MTEPITWYDSGPVRPCETFDNPRCAECQTDDPRSGQPMFHPAHRHGRCLVILTGGDQCKCTSTRVF